MTLPIIRFCPYCKDRMEKRQRKFCLKCNKFFKKDLLRRYKQKYRSNPEKREMANKSAREWYRKNALIVLKKKQEYYKQQKCLLFQRLQSVQ